MAGGKGIKSIIIKQNLSNMFDMDFICRDNTELRTKLEKLGHDSTTLFNISKEYFKLCEELNLNSKQSVEFFSRIKNVHNYFKGSPLYNIVMYENSRTYPTRLCIENQTSKKSVFFKIVPQQAPTEKKNVNYYCESCSNIVKVKRLEAQNHFLKYHNN